MFGFHIFTTQTTAKLFVVWADEISVRVLHRNSLDTIMSK